MKKAILFCAVVSMGMAVSAQTTGGISSDMLVEIQKGYAGSAADKALHNAIANNSIDKLAANVDNRNGVDTYFSHKVKSKGITNQKSSGRCWLFTGLNVLRAQMMAQHNLPKLELSQVYCFFWDQLEKSNLFLQGIIDTADRPMDDKMVDWLFQNPIGDGGQYTGVSELIMKYGVVPAEIMNETNTSNNTAKMRQLLALKLREYGLELRQLQANGADSAQLAKRKTAMLSDVYRMLVLNYGEPPVEFEWSVRDDSGKPLETKTYTPQSFYREFAGNDLRNDYVMLMNDPSRDYYKLYEIDFDRHNYDGSNWTYINLPVDDIKQMAIESIKNNDMMYFSCDVGKFIDRDRGILDVNNFDYGSLLGTEFGMDKRQRIITHASGSSHAMTLMAVDLDESGKPKKWMVENSWGPGANDGHLIMTDEWFNEYMFRLVVNKKYVPKKILKILEQTPVMLPAWDPMFAPEQ